MTDEEVFAAAAWTMADIADPINLKNPCWQCGIPATRYLDSLPWMTVCGNVACEEALRKYLKEQVGLNGGAE